MSGARELTGHSPLPSRIEVRRWSAFVAAALLLISACAEPELPVVAPPLDDVLELVEVIELADETEPRFSDGTIMYPTGKVGVLLERRDGSLVISDGLVPRVRAYSADGSVEAAFGRYGQGPWEFRSVSGLAETDSGKLIVSSSSNSWLTQLNADLTPDALLPTPGSWASRVWTVGDDIVFRGYVGTSRDSWTLAAGELHRLRLADGVRTWSSWPSPLEEKPYWGSLSHVVADVEGDSIYVMAAALYPLTVLNGSGDSIGTIGRPPPWFRRIPDIPEGALAARKGESPDYSALPRIMASFDLVLRVHVIAGDYLVFTLGRWDPARGLAFRSIHTSIEVYNRHTGQKLVESVPLPEGSQVLGGDRFLYVLLDKDLPPWRIGKYRLIVER